MINTPKTARFLRHAAMAAFILLTPLSYQVAAQNGSPTLEETLGWLRGKLSESYRAGVFLNPYAADERVFNFQPVKFDGCTLVWRDDFAVSQRKRKEVTTTQTEIQLSEFSPGSVTVSKEDCYASPCWRLDLETRNSKRVVKEGDVKGSSVDYTIKESSVSFFFREEDLARRAGKAFSHAIELCGGKAEPF